VDLARELPNLMPGRFHGYDEQVPLYLAHRIGMDQGFALDDMTAFNPESGAMTLRELFGLTTGTIPHPVFRYRLEVQAGHVFRVGVPELSGSLQFHGMVVSCEARVGGRLVMTYRQVLDTQQLGAQGGGSISVGGDGRSVGATHDNELTSSESEWVTSPNYLAPDFFTPGFMSMQGSAGLQGGAARHQGSTGVSAQIIQFGGQSGISFELTSFSSPNFAAGQSLDRSPNASFGAGLEVGPGHSRLDGPATGAAGPERHAAGGYHRTNGSTLLLTTTLYFDTGRDEIGATGSAELQSLVSRVRAFRAEHPDCHFELEVIANASPRWTGARNAQEAADLNGRLSQRRATAVVTDLQSHLGATDCSYRNTVRVVPGDNVQDEYGEPCEESSPRVGAQGSDEAVQHGVGQHEDPQEWRSVEIHVYRNEYEQDYIQGYRQP
jgi:outer membrane protein OmpA-like peptidoglycan-associated protein